MDIGKRERKGKKNKQDSTEQHIRHTKSAMT